MAQFDWLLTGQDFPVLPTDNKQFLLPCEENNHKKLYNSMKFYLLK
jgi:hypothetical protein